MGRAWYRMTPEIAVEDFHDDNEIEVPLTGLRYRMTERDGRYYMRQFRVDSAGREIAVDERELVWVVGSNNHSRTYVTLLDGRMFQAPVCWYPGVGRWDLCPGFEFRSKHFSRGISETCVFCHNGRMELVEGERHRFREPFPHGIDCERCHGPGSLHVAKWQAQGATPTGDRDPTIVNPRRLPFARRIQVCFQCHLGDSKATSRVRRPGRSLLDFRPGQPLTEVMVPLSFRDPLEHEFGISAQADRLMLSRCYAESDGGLECLTCHNPHVSVYNPARPPDFFRRKCLRCHAVEDCAGQSHAREATAGLADDCVACHMRKAGPDDHPHTRFTDHWIRRAPESRPAARASLDVEPVLPEAYAALPAGERAFYAGRAAMLLSERTLDPRRRGMWDRAQRSFETAIDRGFDTDEAWFFFGLVRSWMDQVEPAERAYRNAVERRPDNYDAAFALGQNLAAQERTAEAHEVFQQMLQHHPGDAGVLAELGRLAFEAGRPDQSVELYARAIEDRPWESSLFLNRGRVYAATGRLDEAIADAREAARLSPDDPKVWDFYGRVLLLAGRNDEAEEAGNVLVRLAKGARMVQQGLVEPPPGMGETMGH